MDGNLSKKLAVFIPNLCGGGAERVMVMVCNAFSCRGYKVDLVLVSAKGEYLSEVAPGVRIVNFNKKRVSLALVDLIKYLRDERPSSFLSALNHANIVAIIAHRISKVKTRLFVSERNSISSIGVGIKASVLKSAIRLLYPLSERVIAVSEGVARELVDELLISSEKVLSIPNPLDINLIQRLAREQISHPWFEVGQPPVILAVGRLAPQKDYQVLIEAFSLIKEKRNVRLVILGEGSLRQFIESIIKNMGLSDSVQLVGFQSNPFAWMAACKVYVMSSKFEGFPNSLIQALACGASVVSTDCPTGPSEILEDGKWGRLVPVGDSVAMAAEIMATLDDISPQSGVCERVNDFRSEVIFDRYENVLF